jgi:hypothetical protein
MSVTKWKNWLAGLPMIWLVLGLAGCGGGGGGAGAPILGGGTTGPAASSLQVRFANATVDNTGNVNNAATVTALDANGRALAGVPLTLRVDNNATYSVPGNATGTTGADGTLVANVTIGSDLSLRKITLTASAGALSASGSFDVVGSRRAASDLTLTAPASIQNSVTSVVTINATAVDANRNALAAIPVTFSVDSGATITPAGTETNAAGGLSAQLRIGADQSNRDITVRATSGTVVRELKVKVVGTQLSVAQFTPAVATGAPTKVKYLLLDNTSGKMADYEIAISTSAGGSVRGRTDVNGEFTYDFNAPAQAQTLTITAQAAGQTNVQQISVTGTVVVPPADAVVNSASVSASPQSVAVNTAGSTTNNVEIRALFLGANNRPVRNVRVWFDLDGDRQTIGGTLASAADRVLVYSDANGVARTTYAPGVRFSPKDGVTIRACYSPVDFPIPAEGAACPAQARTTLTVSSESLSVSIGTNATLEIGASGLTYVKRYAVQVVDSSGQAKSGVTISPSVDLLRYYKGTWERAPANDRWLWGGRGNTYPAVYPVSGVTVNTRLSDTVTAGWAEGNASVCGNEDLNRNGVGELFFDTAEGAVIDEDQNGSALLTPARPRLDPRKADVSITMEGTGLTDANGVAVLKIEYPQNLASWVEFNILVSASGVAGTEGRANYQGLLPVLAAAVTNMQAEPAFRFSPYGSAPSPAYFRRNADGQSGFLCTNPN